MNSKQLAGLVAPYVKNPYKELPDDVAEAVEKVLDKADELVLAYYSMDDAICLVSIIAQVLYNNNLIGDFKGTVAQAFKLAAGLVLLDKEEQDETD